MSRAEHEAVLQRMANRREVIRAAREQFDNLDAVEQQQIRIQFERAADEARTVVHSYLLRTI